jgi:hypothetical protein
MMNILISAIRLNYEGCSKSVNHFPYKNIERTETFSGNSCIYSQFKVLSTMKESDCEDNVPLAIFEPPDPTKRPMYAKHLVYQGNTEFSFEELWALKVLKKKKEQDAENRLLQEREEVSRIALEWREKQLLLAEREAEMGRQQEKFKRNHDEAIARQQEEFKRESQRMMAQMQIMQQVRFKGNKCSAWVASFLPSA